jgi:4-hydroxybenzoate polyprenyltransferase
MWNKILTWLKDNTASFLLSLLIVVGFILMVAFFPKWIIILVASLSYLILFAYKVWKDQPF